VCRASVTTVLDNAFAFGCPGIDAEGTTPLAEVFGVIETALRAHFAKEIPA
jgi:hypothetical protein